VVSSLAPTEEVGGVRIIGLSEEIHSQRWHTGTAPERHGNPGVCAVCVASAASIIGRYRIDFI
jgi:hypothetical protein